MVKVFYLGFNLLSWEQVSKSLLISHISLGFLLLWDFLSNFLKIENLASSALLGPIADNYQQKWLLETSYGSQAIKLQVRLIDSAFPDSW